MIKCSGYRIGPFEVENALMSHPKMCIIDRCEYCGFIVTTGEYDWVLSDITGVRPGMRIDNSGVDIAGGEGQQ